MLLQSDKSATGPARVFQADGSVRVADGGDIHAFDHGIESARKQEDALADAIIMANETAGASRNAFPSIMDDPLNIDLDDLVRRLVAAFRRHPHINNVMTHISGAHWERIEQALRVILHPAASRDDLSPLARNIIELMWAERGVTGRILKPYLHELIARILPRPVADRLLGHIAGLCEAPQADAAHRSFDTVD